MVAEIPHPALGGAPARLIASPLRMTGTPVEIRRAPPMLGEHTDEVLSDLGCDPAEIGRLREAGIVGAR